MEIISSIIALVAFVFGGVFSLVFKKSDKFYQFFMASVFGLSASLIMVELLPDAVNKMFDNYTGDMRFILLIGYSLIGLLIMKVIDSFLPNHEYDRSFKAEHYAHVGYMIVLPVMIYNIIVGMKIGATESPLLMGLGLGLCNFLFGTLITGLFSKTFTKTNRLLITIGIIGLAAPIGYFMYYILTNYYPINDNVLVLISSVSLGMMAYVTVFEEFVGLLHTKHTYITILGIISGVCLLFLSHLFYI